MSTGTYQVASLLLVGSALALLQNILFAKRGAEGVVEALPGRPRHLQGALEGGLGRHWDGYRFTVVVATDISKTNVTHLDLGNV